MSPTRFRRRSWRSCSPAASRAASPTTSRISSCSRSPRSSSRSKRRSSSRGERVSSSGTAGATRRRRRGGSSAISTARRSRRSGGRARSPRSCSRAGGSADALANGVPLRTSGLLAGWQELLTDYPDELAAERIEKAAERWGGYAPAALLHDRAARLRARPHGVAGRRGATGARDRLRAQPRPPADREAARRPRRVARDQARAPRRANRRGAQRARSSPCPAADGRAPARLGLPSARSGPNVDRARAWLSDAIEALE